MLTIKEPLAEGRSSSALGEPQSGLWSKQIDSCPIWQDRKGNLAASALVGQIVGHWPPSGHVQYKNPCGRQSGFPSSSWVGKNRSGALSYQALLKVGGYVDPGLACLVLKGLVGQNRRTQRPHPVKRELGGDR